jgi:hypothetical protein
MTAGRKGMDGKKKTTTERNEFGAREAPGKERVGAYFGEL